MPNKIFNSVFNYSNIIITLCNIIFFIVVQTLFFKLIASKQFNIVLQSKMGILNEFANNNDYIKNNLKEFLQSEQAKMITKGAKADNKVRENKNFKLIKDKIGVIVIILLIILIIFIYLAITTKDSWKSVDTSILSLVVFAYTTELMFYFGIVRNYIFVGDQKLYDNIYKKTKDKVNFDNVNSQLLNNLYKLNEIKNNLSDIDTSAITNNLFTSEGSGLDNSSINLNDGFKNNLF